MKKITAVIQPAKFQQVCAGLEALGYPGMTVTKVTGHGRQRGVVKQWLGKQFRQNYLPKIRLDMVVADRDLKKTLECIIQGADTAAPGAGKIFVSKINEAIRIRTRE